ncbi:MAG TPA: phosphatidate cytidylyltransferase [Oscillospiraceae bacterium]|nr:phosphatidate cytidylyltransferase [Oscillospiraceae bacterium]HPF56363.1 phosphatidate cytidylyltransferase [Clostridiales bacterium]HPK34287.1 phosphatidate cytidylyltransferase [Oscillospiraceae bacterium]HPR74810.1 phosphatidate cytidylyltransferase [Oscillospiraceae bacterium]
MKQRFITSIILILIIGAAFFATTFAGWVLGAVMYLLAMIAVYESLKVMKLLRLKLLSLACFAYPTVVSALIFTQNSAHISDAAIGYMVILMFLAVIYRSSDRAKFSVVAMAGLFTVYITTGFSALTQLQKQDNLQAGAVLAAVIVLGAWAGDVGGWLFGITMGKHKLCPTISPKKTIEGFIGSVVFSEIAFIGLAFLSRLAVPEQPLNWVVFAFIAPFAAIFGLMGDLTASVLKREHNVKDFGTIVVGHGGVMDRFDGVLMTSILFLLASKFVNFFG